MDQVTGDSFQGQMRAYFIKNLHFDRKNPGLGECAGTLDLAAPCKFPHPTPH